MSIDKRVVELPENSYVIVANNADNPLRGVTVLKFGRTGRFPIAIQNAAKCFENARLVRTNDGVCSMRDSYGPLCIVAQCEARYAENRGLLLKSTRVREHDCRTRFEIQEFKISERVHRPDPVYR